MRFSVGEEDSTREATRLQTPRTCRHSRYRSFFLTRSESSFPPRRLPSSADCSDGRLRCRVFIIELCASLTQSFGFKSSSFNLISQALSPTFKQPATSIAKMRPPVSNLTKCIREQASSKHRVKAKYGLESLGLWGSC